MISPAPTLKAYLKKMPPAFVLAVFALAVVLPALSLSGCAGKPVAAPAADAGAATEPPRMIGGDRDMQGCLPAAGYTWCAREQRCVRPWELAKKAGFENTADGFAEYCGAATAAPVR